MSKETYLKEKIKNFIIFIREKIGEENKIYINFTNYLNDMSAFLRDILPISEFKIDKESIANILNITALKQN